MRVELLDWRDAGWQPAAAMIESHFRAGHGAEITLPALRLAVALSANGRILGAAGLRDAKRGFFSQIYLDQPVETLLSRQSGSPVGAEEIIEVASMACPYPAATLPLIEAITAEGRRMGKSWGLFTATGPLMRLLRRTGVPLLPLAPARPERLPDAGRWGRYYQTNPWVCALQEGVEHLRFMPRRRPDHSGVHAE